MWMCVYLCNVSPILMQTFRYLNETEQYPVKLVTCINVVSDILDEIINFITATTTTTHNIC